MYIWSQVVVVGRVPVTITLDELGMRTQTVKEHLVVVVRVIGTVTVVELAGQLMAPHRGHVVVSCQRVELWVVQGRHTVVLVVVGVNLVTRPPVGREPLVDVPLSHTTLPVVLLLGVVHHTFNPTR
jgi:hypothetical protein